MTKTVVRVGMLGAGFIGQMHSLAFRNASVARAEPAVSAQFVSVGDQNATATAEVAERYEWAATATDWTEALNSGIDLFINAGPNSTHAPASIDAANLGIAVFCEKPLSSSADEAYDLWKAVESAGVMNRTAFMHRFIPAIQLARQMVRAGELGEIRNFRSTFLLNMLGPDGSVSWRFSRGAAGHGALGDLGSHHIDLARFLVAEVIEVAALTKTWTKDPAGVVTDVNDDTFLAIGTLENGATATFQASRAAAAHSLTSLIEIDGTKGSLSWGMERLNELVVRKPGQGPQTLPVLRPGHPYDGFWLPGGIQGSHPLGWNECFAHQAHDILALASGKKTESVAATFADGYRVAEIVDTIEAAAKAGSRQTIKFRS
jgi:predicted dehydrogenase